MVDNKHGFRVDYLLLLIYTYYRKATWHVGPTHGLGVVAFVVIVLIVVVLIFFLGCQFPCCYYYKLL